MAIVNGHKIVPVHPESDIGRCERCGETEPMNECPDKPEKCEWCGAEPAEDDRLHARDNALVCRDCSQAPRLPFDQR